MNPNEISSSLHASKPLIDTVIPKQIATATFALGCFWGPDSRFGSIPGVVRTRVGYAGGTKQNPIYHSLGDHSETVQIDYDPSKLSYRDLLHIFWTGHEPTYPSGSRQYASIIFVHNDEQRRAAEKSKTELEHETGRKVYTEIVPYSGFTMAEDYHQKYNLRRSAAFYEELIRIYPSSVRFLDCSGAGERISGRRGLLRRAPEGGGQSRAFCTAERRTPSDRRTAAGEYDLPSAGEKDCGASLRAERSRANDRTVLFLSDLEKRVRGGLSTNTRKKPGSEFYSIKFGQGTAYRERNTRLEMRKETQCVHSGAIKDTMYSGVNSPIFTSTAFNYLDREEVAYPRYFNTPNQNAVVAKVCALEGTEDGVLFSSGMAAISTAILAFVRSGDHVVMMDELYGGTHAFAASELPRMGITYTFAATDADAICSAVQESTKVIVIESPTNPLLSVVDIRKISIFARQRNVVTVIDNTLATPLYQNPSVLGIDVVVHSGTKYLGGHSDISCGIALASKEKAERIRAVARNLGGNLNAATCAQLERSLMTLAIRVGRQTENADRLAHHLEKHDKVRRVHYPGLASSAYHALATSQMNGFGAMLSFELDDAKADPDRFVRGLRIIKPAVSLGGIESTICAPAVTSHAKISAVDRKRIGIPDSLLRLSVGIEQADDLIEDIEQAVIA